MDEVNTLSYSTNECVWLAFTHIHLKRTPVYQCWLTDYEFDHIDLCRYPSRQGDIRWCHSCQSSVLKYVECFVPKADIVHYYHFEYLHSDAPNSGNRIILHNKEGVYGYREQRVCEDDPLWDIVGPIGVLFL